MGNTNENAILRIMLGLCIWSWACGFFVSRAQVAHGLLLLSPTPVYSRPDLLILIIEDSYLLYGVVEQELAMNKSDCLYDCYFSHTSS